MSHIGVDVPTILPRLHRRIPRHYGRTSVTLLKHDKIGLKILSLGLNLLPFCRRYENVIHSSVAITTKEIIVL